jgi:glycyl-tRNA synthetase beta chain
MTDFLLELRSEEIPARMQAKGKDDLARLFAEEIAKAGLTAQSIETFATPRRLAIIARGLPDETQSVSEERKGPRANAPEQALAGFLRSTGLTREQLTERDGVLFAVIDKPGRPTADVLSEGIPAIIRAFPWPKSMRWGDASISTESLRWVRPLQGIVALFGEAIVECEVDGIVSGAATMGHRFHHHGPITIGSANDYVEKLRACHVIVHLSERRKLIEEGAAKAAAAAGLTVIPDEGLVLENAGLTEWPVPLLGRFDSAFLDVPREVIQLTMRTNQKYFACADAEGRLANAFVCTANIDAHDGGAAVIAGNEKVLSARLSDAKFFWEQDLKVSLEDQALKLKDIVFHEKLGTVADKVERVAKLARWLVESGVVKPFAERQRGAPPSASEAFADKVLADARTSTSLALGEADLAQMAETAARLCKADLVTGMVGEFPELQGIMGGYYARAQGLPDAAADAIRDHYKPVGQGDDVPTAPVTVAVSLADKLDTLICFFAIDERPTGSKDPYALRRAALSCMRIVLENDLRIGLDNDLETITWDVFNTVIDLRRGQYLSEQLELPLDEWGRFHRPIKFDNDFYVVEVSSDRVERVPILRSLLVLENLHVSMAKLGVKGLDETGLLYFFADRLKVQQREAGVRHDLIDAVFALGGEDDLVRLLARVKALQSFVGTDEGKNLLSGYKRAANILKKTHPSPLAGVSGRSSPGRTEDGWGPSSPETGDSASAERGEGDKGNLVDSSFKPLTPLAGGESPSPARGEGKVSLSYKLEPAEHALIDALDSAEPLATAAIEREDFEAAMSALASLRAPIDAFFETVTVNDPDKDKRDARLALLARVRDAVHRVADFSKIEG